MFLRVPCYKVLCLSITLSVHHERGFRSYGLIFFFFWCLLFLLEPHIHLDWILKAINAKIYQFFSFHEISLLKFLMIFDVYLVYLFIYLFFATKDLFFLRLNFFVTEDFFFFTIKLIDLFFIYFFLVFIVSFGTSYPFRLDFKSHEC